MKKIIATVLAMVMALALCTTAFAATSYSSSTTGGDKSELTAKNYTLLDMNNKEQNLGTVTSLYFYTAKVFTETEDGETTKTVTPAYYVLTCKTVSGTDATCVAVVVDKSIATGKVVKGGNIENYVYFTDDSISAVPALPTADKVVTATKTAVAEADAECGDYYVTNGKGGETLYVIDGKVYAAATSNTGNYALLNDKLVAYEATALTAVSHVLDGGKVNTEKGVITSAYCTNCKQYISVVKKVPVDSIDVYEAAVWVEDTAPTDTYFYKVGSAAVADTTDADTTTTSPKTFDAGIAMYVGMALTSVAGSAVVIGKKKEF